MNKAQILVVDDDAGHLSMLRTVLSGWGFVPQGASDGEQAVAMVREKAYDAVLLDVRMAGMGGMEALSRIKEYNPSVPVIIMTAYSSVETAIAALKTGAYDYLTKPLDLDVLRLTLERALDHMRLAAENASLREQLGPSAGGQEIIGKSKAMRDLFNMIGLVAPTEATVLITGESGTGKELVAKAIHAGSPRASGPLVAVNCAALSETLLESELFGHEKGAFTGAERRREGRFLAANKGSIFLDEIGEIAQPIQAKLLRVIQEREIQRVGGDKPVGVDVRILAATNRDLKKEVEEGRFREDLYYRLNVVSITVPPLRERAEDIPLLAQFFLARFAEKNRKRIKGFTPSAMDNLIHCPWPGNVRELENAVERAVILSVGEYVSERELPLCDPIGTKADAGAGAGDVGGLTGRALDDVEREVILATLESCGGNKSETARVLGITRATLHKKLKKYGDD
ncbi:two component, sigma54 specific, transcriptional regulator, Fis family [Solidesulfovibrio fructosivorans JJ]]|uniref:Two component, sigma54 specific, transcriptional regulator, Fis family n=1 Tax=Solidesulfovibrio fructosivorans JJ] TaxID=596151 RepID=E1JW69_SOLFR|nr:sigma 54-interacting transcriptional regulator [Solidesulfovibrio fructosivorans]EFL51429.1 two component, sigma54 specific, transcriptional regulator, Fis family [Solidesulfovibrio fructosivorans JJ]]